MADIDEKEFRALLPKLKGGSESKVGAFKSGGTWDNRQASELSNLSESLDVTQIDPKYFDIDSIPDMWARPLLFEMALYDPTHMLHKRVLGEWRGLLALLALRELRSLGTIAFEPIEIPLIEEEKEKQAEREGGERNENGGADAETQPKQRRAPDFLKGLSRLAPTTQTLGGGSSWHSLYVILLGEEPIGITSPTTLVCTAADCYGRVSPSVTWFRTRFLEDPVPRLSQMDRSALVLWIDEAVRMGNRVDQESDLWNQLSKLLKRFRDDLKARPLAGGKVVSRSPRMNGIFSYIDGFVQRPDVDPSESAVSLVPSEGRDPRTTLLVVDKSIATQWDMAEQDVSVLGAITLAAIPLGGLSGRRTELLGMSLDTDNWSKPAEWVKPEELFTESLFVIERQRAFLNLLEVHGSQDVKFRGDFVTPILPIKQKLLEYLTPADLAKRVTLQSTGDTIKVSLTLPLTGPVPDEPREIEVWREYGVERQGPVRSLPNVPLLEIWPDFSSPSWKAYYTCISTRDIETTFVGKPYPYPSADEPERVRTIKDDRGDFLEITETDTQPEAIVCSAIVPNANASKMVGVEAGLLLLNPADKVEQQVREWKVGVDFGTTNTTVFARWGTFEPERIDLEPYFRQITNPEATDRQRLIFLFLPIEKLPTPFLSLFKDISDGSGKKRLRPLLDGHINFLDGYQKFDPDDHTIVTDLKWGSKAGRVRARAFLEQLCLQCSAELIKKQAASIAWRFSFPEAFSVDDREDFEDIWQKITVACATKTGLSSDIEEADTRSKSEGIASAHFFAAPPDKKRSMKPKMAIGALCVDIGGGTSDISIWQGADASLKLQTSLRFAGRDMLINILQRNPSLLQRVFNVEDAQLEPLTGRLEFFYAKADAVMAERGSDFVESLSTHRADPEVKEFIQILALGFCGMFYYAGLLLRWLIEAKRYEPHMPNVYVGGNGSKILHWLAGGAYNPDKAVTGLLQNVIVEASQLGGGKFEIHLSPEPKSEVAYGLLKDDAQLLYLQEPDERQPDEKRRSANATLIAGEAFSQGDSEYDWDELIDASRIKRGLKISKLDNFIRFLETFNRFGPSAGIMPTSLEDFQSPESVARHLAAVNEAFGKLAKSVEREIRVEPPFITALKLFLNERCDDWARRYGEK